MGKGVQLLWSKVMTKDLTRMTVPRRNMNFFVFLETLKLSGSVCAVVHYIFRPCFTPLTLIPVCSAQATNLLPSLEISQPAMQMMLSIFHLQLFQVGQPTHHPKILKQLGIQSRNGTQTEKRKTTNIISATDAMLIKEFLRHCSEISVCYIWALLEISRTIRIPFSIDLCRFLLHFFNIFMHFPVLDQKLWIDVITYMALKENLIQDTNAFRV